MGKNVLINEDSLKDLANALRGKSGSSEKFKVKNMDDFVESLNIAPEGTKIVDEDTIVLDPDEVEIAETSYDVDPMQMSVTAHQQDVEAVSVVSNETLIKANANISTRISNGEIVNAINNFGPESVIVPENIKRDVNILGIIGTLEAEPEDLTDAISITENILGREEPEEISNYDVSKISQINITDKDSGDIIGNIGFNTNYLTNYSNRTTKIDTLVINNTNLPMSQENLFPNKLVTYRLDGTGEIFSITKDQIAHTLNPGESLYVYNYISFDDLYGEEITDTTFDSLIFPGPSDEVPDGETPYLENYSHLFGSYNINVNDINGQQVGTLDFNNVTFYKKGGSSYIQYEAENNTDYTFDENPYFIGSDFYFELYLDTSAGETHIASLSYPYPYNPHIPRTMEASAYIDLSTLSQEEIENNIRIEYSTNVDMQENQPQPVEHGSIQATIYLGSEGEEETHVDASSVTVINSNSGEDITSQINFQAYDGINNVSELPLNTDLEITWHLNNEDYNDVTSAHYLTSSETEYITLVSQQKVEPELQPLETGKTYKISCKEDAVMPQNLEVDNQWFKVIDFTDIKEEHGGISVVENLHLRAMAPSYKRDYTNSQVTLTWTEDGEDRSCDYEEGMGWVGGPINVIATISAIWDDISGEQESSLSNEYLEVIYTYFNFEEVIDPEPEYEEKEISFSSETELTCSDGKMRYYPGEDKLIFEVTVTNNTPEDIDVPEGKLEGGAYGGTVNSLEFNTKERFNPDDSEVITATCLKDENGHISLNTSDGDVNYSSYLDAFNQVTNIYLGLHI